MIRAISILALVLLITVSCKNQLPVQKADRVVNPATNETISKEYAYQTFENDPLNTRLYELDNGLKVYLSVYKDEPRIQTSIAVATGSKNDPSNATGLAHYLEHMLFKGTKSFGTKDYDKEKPFLDEIRALYEEHRGEKGQGERKLIYRKIDSISNLASNWSIANEYDKMLSTIGAKGTNAYTSNDETVYINDIPTNQINNWLKIEADRFMNPVLRIFHTELEAVYEEKNRSLDSDRSKVWETVLHEVFKGHTYGTQSTIGTIDHLKNPSIVEIENYMNKYYVPNNIAICMSGDFNPDEVIRQIDMEFGSWEKKVVEPFQQSMLPITQKVHKEIVGPEEESVMMAYQFKGIANAQMDTLNLVDMILMNGMAGLFDLNLNQAQKVLQAQTYIYKLKEGSMHVLMANPKQGQSHEEVVELLNQQVSLLKKGKFEASLIPAIINDYKLSTMNQLESNYSRTSRMVDCFINEMDLSYSANQIDRMAKIQKEEIIDFVNRHYKDNYVELYKLKGERESNKVEKPEITPVKVNREAQSDFVKEVVSAEVDQISPVFINFEKDIKEGELKAGVPLYYIENKENETFSINFRWNIGKSHSEVLGLASNFFSYLGTEKNTNSEIQKKFFEIGASYQFSVGEKNTTLYLSGLTENLERALVLLEDIFVNAKADQSILDNLVQDVLKERENLLSDRSTILRGALYEFAKYGENSKYLNIVSKEDLLSLKAEDVLKELKDLLNYQHEIFFYGNKSVNEVRELLNLHHKLNRGLINPSAISEREASEIDRNEIYFVHYEMEQAEFMMLSKGGQFDSTLTPMVTLYNNYFGGGMGGIVFQEIRESKALAYSAYSSLRSPSKMNEHYYNLTYVGTQADKLKEAIEGIQLIINEMPQADKNLEIAKQSVIQKIRTERINKESVYYTLKTMQKLGLKEDPRKMTFEMIETLSMEDLVSFQKKYVSNQPYKMIMIGNKNKIDFEMLKKYGELKILELENIFAY